MADNKPKTRAGTVAQPFPWEEALEAQLERTKKRMRGLATDPVQEGVNIVRQYLHDPTLSPEENERKLDELAMGLAGTTKLPTPKLMKASEVFGPHEGKTAMFTESDRTKVGGGFLGGSGFSGLQLELPAYKGKAWGVASMPKAQTIIGSNQRVPEGQAIWAPYIGHPEQHRSNQMVFDQIFNQFRREAKKGNLPNELKDKINERLASELDSTGQPLYPPDVDIMAKNFRQLSNTFERRAKAAEIMGGKGVGGKKGSIIDYPGIIESTTDPALISAPTWSVGHRAFTLTGDVGIHPELHPAFPYLLHGEDLGKTFVPVPHELAMRDFIEKVKREKGRKVGYMDLARGYAPEQFISEDWLTALQKAGYAQGGLAMAAGGQTFPLQRPEAVTDLTPRPHHPLAELAGRGANAAHHFLSAPFGYENPPGEMASSLLGIPDIAKTLERIGYDEPITSGAGMTFNPLPETSGAALSVLPIVPAAAKYGKAAAKALAPTMADMLEAELQKSGMMMSMAPEAKVGKAKVPANKLGFYNPAEKAALNLQRKKGTGDTFISDLKKQPGVNDERIAELGLDQFKGKPDVTNADIYATARENRIPLEESVRRERDEAAIEELERRHDEILEYKYEAEAAGDRRSVAEYEDELQENIAEQKRLKGAGEARFSPTHYPQYNMPGGTDYREIRVKVQPRMLSEEEARKVLGAAPDAKLSKADIQYASRKNQEEFTHQAHHGDEPDVLLHIRGANHVDAEGKKGFLIDELQSDWHQQGKQKGYGPQYQDQYRAYYETPQGQVDIGFGKTPEELERMVKASGWDTMPIEIKTEKTTSKVREGVPDAPFKDNWYQLGLKRAIKEAADTGMDRVYLTTGARQADRYDLSKQLNSVSYRDGVLKGYDKNNELVINQSVQPKDLSDYVGKDLASKMAENSAKTTEIEKKLSAAIYNKAPQSEIDALRSELSKFEPYYSGLDLQVGGEGMKQWYDKTYKNYLEKYAKQHGSKLGMTNILTYTPEEAQIVKQNAARMYGEDSDTYAQIMNKVSEPVYYIDITDAMRNSAKKGQSYAEGGAVKMADGGVIDLEHMMTKRIMKGFASGGAAYNTIPDISDSEKIIQGPAV